MLQTLIFAHRHKVFVERLGWEAIRRPDDLETDAFDTDSAVHFIVLSPLGSIAAYSRLLPTTHPHLLSRVYPHLLGPEAKLPIGEHVWEWTRLTCIPKPVPTSTSTPTRLPFTLSPPGRILILGIVNWALEHGLTTLSLQCDPAFSVVITALGARVEVLAEPSRTAEGESVVPMLMHVDRRAVEKAREVFDRMDKDEEGVRERAKL
jgi:acyl-homoserine lactone synthase